MIILHKGDTFSKNIVLRNYELQKDDILKVGIKKRIGDTDYVLPVKELHNLQTQFEYTPEETKDIIPDTYILEIELTYANGRIATLKQEQLKVEGVIIDE